MLHTLVDDGPHMTVRQRVEYSLAVPAALYQAVLLKDSQLV